MSTITLIYPNDSHGRRLSAIGLITILVIISLALIGSAILIIVLSPTRDANPADLMPVVRSSPDSLPVAVPVPTPPIADIQLNLSGTPAPSLGMVQEPSVVPVPVPTPPSQ